MGPPTKSSSVRLIVLSCVIDFDLFCNYRFFAFGYPQNCESLISPRIAKFDTYINSPGLKISWKVLSKKIGRYRDLRMFLGRMSCRQCSRQKLILFAGLHLPNSKKISISLSIWVHALIILLIAIVKIKRIILANCVQCRDHLGCFARFGTTCTI